MTHGSRLLERRVGAGDTLLGFIEPARDERPAQRELRRPDLLQVVGAATE